MRIRDQPEQLNSHVMLFIKYGKPQDVFAFMINRTNKQAD